MIYAQVTILHCPPHTSCCMHWFLARNVNPVFVSECHVTYLLTHSTVVWYILDDFFYSNELYVLCIILLLCNAMITPVKILCTTLPHSPRTSYSNSTQRSTKNRQNVLWKQKIVVLIQNLVAVIIVVQKFSAAISVLVLTFALTSDCIKTNRPGILVRIGSTYT